MKNILCLLMIVFGINYSIAQTNSLKTQTITPLSVPEVVKQAFITEFPTIQPIWKMDDKNYKAVYEDLKTNTKGIIIYDPEGKIVNREMDVKTTKDPE